MEMTANVGPDKRTAVALSIVSGSSSFLGLTDPNPNHHGFRKFAKSFGGRTCDIQKG
jgi:hypothetical protein